MNKFFEKNRDKYKLVYADKNGIYRCKISLENRRGGFEEMIKFHEEAIKVIISDDCNLGFSTDI